MHGTVGSKEWQECSCKSTQHTSTLLIATPLKGEFLGVAEILVRKLLCHGVMCLLNPLCLVFSHLVIKTSATPRNSPKRAFQLYSYFSYSVI